MEPRLGHWDCNRVGTVYAYYGGADRVIGLATCALDELLEFVCI